MPRYFFHIANSKTFKDDLGEQFLGVAEAMAHATDIAKALGEDAGWRDCSVVVEDENGTEVGRVLVNVVGYQLLLSAAVTPLRSAPLDAEIHQATNARSPPMTIRATDAATSPRVRTR
jgi:hypothetical protein